MRIGAVVVAAWLIAKREWGLLFLAVAAFGVYLASIRTRAGTAGSTATAATTGVPSGFTTGTENVEGSASPTTLVQGISPTIPGDCG